MSSSLQHQPSHYNLQPSACFIMDPSAFASPQSYMFSEDPIKIGQRVVLQITQKLPENRDDLLIGVTFSNPRNLDWEQLPEPPISSGSSLEHDWCVVAKIPSVCFFEGDEFAYFLTSDKIFYQMNNEQLNSIPNRTSSQANYWPFCKISGSNVKIRMFVSCNLEDVSGANVEDCDLDLALACSLQSEEDLIEPQPQISDLGGHLENDGVDCDLDLALACSLQSEEDLIEPHPQRPDLGWSVETHGVDCDLDLALACRLLSEEDLIEPQPQISDLGGHLENDGVDCDLDLALACSLQSEEDLIEPHPQRPDLGWSVETHGVDCDLDLALACRLQSEEDLIEPQPQISDLGGHLENDGADCDLDLACRLLLEDGLIEPQPQRCEVSSRSINNETNNKCCVCLEEVINCIIQDCGHVELCFECAQRVRDTEGDGGGNCPLCRRPIQDIIKLY